MRLYFVPLAKDLPRGYIVILMKTNNYFPIAVILAFLIAISVSAESSIDTVPELNCKAACLIDTGTGAVLFEKNSGIEIPPASMTKLVTLHLVYKAIAEGKIAKDEVITIDRNADFRSLPPHSSLMFLEKGQKVTVLDLMRGLAVPSGNDAAIALAELVGGSVGNFVSMMNEEVKRLGFSGMHFEDASGLSENNRVSARDFAYFCVEYIKLHPESLTELHSISEFTYPKGGSSVYGPIKQNNRNSLLGRYVWADGLKTGYIDESGYNIAVTAETGGRRLVAVLLGGPGKNAGDGGLTRAVDAVNLLSYGFYRFTNYIPDPSALKSVKVYGGKRDSLKVLYPELKAITLPREAAYITELVFRMEKPVLAPVRKGDEIGRLEVRIRGKAVSSYPVKAGEDVLQGSLVKRFLSWVKLLFKRPVLVRKL